MVLIGGGNSAGQATVYLAGKAAKVGVLVRGTGLASSMSSSVRAEPSAVSPFAGIVGERGQQLARDRLVAVDTVRGGHQFRLK